MRYDMTFEFNAIECGLLIL